MHLQPGSLAVHLILRSVQRTTSNAYSGLGSTSCLRMAIQPASCWRSRPTSTTSTRGILDALDIVSDEETLSSSSCGDESGRTKSKLHARAQARRDGAMEAARSAIRTAAVEVAANTASTNRSTICMSTCTTRISQLESVNMHICMTPCRIYRMYSP